MIRLSSSAVRIPLLIVLLGSTAPAAWAQVARVPEEVPAYAEAASWPMLAANPQRTSWTPEEVRGSLGVEWYRPIEPYIPYKVQPVAANGRIYVSTARGLYAFNAASGNLDWVFPTEMPLGHSPTVATVNGTSVIYVGGYDHRIHALDATTGRPLGGYTAYEAGAGFETNPLIVNNTVYAGNRDGFFYALDAVSGGLKWKYETGGPILFSAAFKDGTLYFASNDACAYALNAPDGSLVWKSQELPGQGFHSYWPVIYTDQSSGKDYVIFSTGENYRFFDLYPEGNYSPGLVGVEIEAFLADVPVGQVVGATGNVPGDWAAGTVTIDASRITNYYEEKPYRRTTFILDRATGQEYAFDSDGDGKAEYAPFSWSGVTHGGTRYPPVVNGIDGVIYQQTAYYSGGWASRGAPVGWKFGTHYISRIAQGSTSSGTTASDEPSAFSSGGKLVYHTLCCDRYAASMDVTIPYGGGSRAWTIFNYSLNGISPDYDAMYNDGTDSYNDINGFQEYTGNLVAGAGQGTNLNGVYGKHGTDQSPAIPYQGRLYFLRGNALIAFGASGGGRKLALATTVSAPGYSSPVTKPIVAQRLEAEIQKMLAAGHMRPGYIAHGLIDQYGDGRKGGTNEYGELFDYFQNPAETVVTLTQALPYLSAGTQSAVKTYLQNNYGLGKAYDFTSIVHVGWNSGAAREPYDIPEDVLSKYTSFAKRTSPGCGGCGYWQSFPPYNFYAAWRYALAFSYTQAQAKTLFDAIDNRPLESPRSDTVFLLKPYWMNQYIAGYWGYLELRKLAGYSDDTAVRSQLNRMLSLRTDSFSRDWPSGAITGQEDPLRGISVMRNFLYTTPEIGDYMGQRILSKVQEAVAEYTYLAPYWFVSKFDNSYNEATIEPLYDYPALFQAKAYILKETFEELVKYLDAPAFAVGDLFYIQNLVAALQAGNSGPTPTFADVPFSHPYHDDIEALYQAGYTAGCNTNPLMYCPEQTMNRAESAVFVERGIHTATYDPPAPAAQVFADLGLDSWAAKWVNGLWQDQYTAGCGTNPLVYCPWQGHTRAEGCVFYLRMMNGATYDPAPPAVQTFTDVPLDVWYAKWAKAAYDAGLLTACQTTPELRFCPNDPLTRALAAYMMVRAKNLPVP
jgi:outer membrane protein assembly factor BamB